MSGILRRFNHPDGIHAIVFEDNGRVAYAYLLEGDSIVGDVWLYNRCPTPNEPEWRRSRDFPFANSRGFIAMEPFDPPETEGEITIEWDGSVNEPVASLLIRGSLHAKLKVGERPGRCKFALKDGPLAKMLKENPMNDGAK